MYGKIFESIYDGTLAEDWRALITFQQFIVLCDSEGVVDMTPSAISRRTGIPVEHIKAGVDLLEKEDPYSRSQREGGKRIVRLDDHRPWGWRIVNHAHYRDLASKEEKRERDRLRLAEKRKNPNENNGVAKRRVVSQDVADRRVRSRRVANVAHADADADTTEGTSSLRSEVLPDAGDKPPANGHDDDPVFLDLPCLERKRFPITESQVFRYGERFPGIDVRQELRNAVAWAEDNPKRRKTLSGAKRFLTGWLTRAQNRGGRALPAETRKRLKELP